MPEAPEPELAFAGLFGLLVLVIGGLVAAALAWFGAKSKSKPMLVAAFVAQILALGVSFPLLRVGYVWVRYWLLM